MDKISLGAIIAVIVCGLFANHSAGSLATQVRMHSGRKHIPVALNFKLAQSYRELFGKNGSYWQFTIANAIYAVGLVVFGISSLIYWLHG
jgi:hypothetical protein